MPIKILAAYIDKLFLKFICKKLKGSGIAKTILKNKNKVGVQKSPDFIIATKLQ